MKEVKSILPQNYGWLEVKLSDEEMDFLWKRIDEDKGGLNWKGHLVGNIDSSWVLNDKDDWFWENVLNKLCLNYYEEFGNVGAELPLMSTKCPYKLSTMWVNHQRQHEFNPLHHHVGVYSFVVWMKIPTSYEEQKKLPIARKTKSREISNFTFCYTNIIGRSYNYTYHMSPEYEGTLLFFPSELQHVVYPFYNCRKERISISGNIAVDISGGPKNL